MLPITWFDSSDENISWQIALPALSFAIGQLIPGRIPSLDNYRVAFFAQLREAAKERHDVIDGKATGKKEGEKPMDGQLVIERKRVGTDTHVTIHELICPLYDRTIEVAGTPPAPGPGGRARGGGGPKRVPNPNISQAPRAQALALETALPNVTVCNCVKAVAATVKPADKPAGKRKSFNTIIGELTDAERTAFWTYVDGLPPTDPLNETRVRFMETLKRGLENVTELRAIMGAPEVFRFAIVEALIDRATERFEEMIDEATDAAKRAGSFVARKADIAIQDLRNTGGNITCDIEDTRLDLRAKTAALRARLGRP